MFRLLSLVLVLVLYSNNFYGQHRCVVLDKNTLEPVVHASIYYKGKYKFHSTITNIDGVAVVNFQFSHLTISHLNYEKEILYSLPDTIFLSPHSYLTSEVTIMPQEPAWIRPMLKKIVKNKDKHYFNKRSILKYAYITQSIADNNYYKYQSDGYLRMRDPDSLKFAFHQTKGTITSVDTTQLTDVANMRRMLYEDFVTEFDKDFIRNHKFSVNEDFKGKSTNEVELVFRMEKDNSDHGRFVIDTARCVILSAIRSSTLKYNEHHRISPFMLSMAYLLTGYKITDWDTDYHVTYQNVDGNLVPKDIRFKFYFLSKERFIDKNAEQYDTKTGGGFTNMEAQLSLSPIVDEPFPLPWLMLPQSWYVRYSTDKSRAYEIKLANLPSTFVLME